MPPAISIIQKPEPSSSTIATSTTPKNRRSVSAIIGRRCAGSRLATAAGRTTNCIVAMPPTHNTAHSRCTNKSSE